MHKGPAHVIHPAFIKKLETWPGPPTSRHKPKPNQGPGDAEGNDQNAAVVVWLLPAATGGHIGQRQPWKAFEPDNGVNAVVAAEGNTAQTRTPTRLGEGALRVSALRGSCHRPSPYQGIGGTATFTDVTP